VAVAGCCFITVWYHLYEYVQILNVFVMLSQLANPVCVDLLTLCSCVRLVSGIGMESESAVRV